MESSWRIKLHNRSQAQGVQKFTPILLGVKCDGAQNAKFWQSGELDGVRRSFEFLGPRMRQQKLFTILIRLSKVPAVTVHIKAVRLVVSLNVYFVQVSQPAS
jgi:hypothetical protein